MWLAWNIAFGEDGLANYFDEDGTQGWLYLVTWSVISVAVLISTLSIVLTT